MPKAIARRSFFVLPPPRKMHAPLWQMPWPHTPFGGSRNLNQANRKGNTPLTLAVYAGNGELAAMSNRNDNRDVVNCPNLASSHSRHRR